MQLKQYIGKKTMAKAGNVLFFGLLLLLLINPGAKAWFLKQLMAVGLFKAEIKKQAPTDTVAANTSFFTYQDEKGNNISTADMKGKVVFINFWATWCPPCRAEMSSINALYNQLKDDNRFVFVFINEDEDVAKAKTFLQSNAYNMPLSVSAGNIPVDIYSGTLPTTVVLNKQGNIVMKHEGLGNYNTTQFIQQLKELL